MRRLLTAAMAAGLLLVPGTAWADHGGGYDGGEYDDRRGDCRHAENCQDNDFSPSFKDSPVRDAFNFAPQVCLPGATCHFYGDRQGEGGQQAPQ